MMNKLKAILDDLKEEIKQGLGDIYWRSDIEN
jgi:hypothetical protein